MSDSDTQSHNPKKDRTLGWLGKILLYRRLQWYTNFRYYKHPSLRNDACTLRQTRNPIVLSTPNTSWKPLFESLWDTRSGMLLLLNAVGWHSSIFLQTRSSPCFPNLLMLLQRQQGGNLEHRHGARSPNSSRTTRLWWCHSNIAELSILLAY